MFSYQNGSWVRIILALGTNHLNFGYELSGYETSVGTKRPVSLRTNALLVGTFLSIDDIRVSIAINTQLFSFTKITSLYLVFKLTSAVFSKY